MLQNALAHWAALVCLIRPVHLGQFTAGLQGSVVDALEDFAVQLLSLQLQSWVSVYEIVKRHACN